eukprot:gb/GEZN01007047.1/.p1 GENE.gb/GEZN01007047.1/~~gb/GEZN01007047.1/.p1  ORF type:complete len:361 (+),score=42.23 gb/GEZN01007047.1/:95-1177(+)
MRKPGPSCCSAVCLWLVLFGLRVHGHSPESVIDSESDSRLIIDHIDEPSDEDYRDLSNAAGMGDLDKVIEFVTVKGLAINKEVSAGRSPLISAISGKQELVLSWLLDHGANTSFVDRFGHRAHYTAVSGGSLGVLKLLLDVDSSPPLDVDSWTMLHRAASGTERGHREIAEYLIRDIGLFGVDSKTPNGMTPLMVAAHQGLTETVNLLIQLGAKPNEGDKNRRGALFYALYGYIQKRDTHDSRIQYELAQKKEQEGSTGRIIDITPRHIKEADLFKAKQRKAFYDTILALIGAGANPNAKDKFGDTPYAFATMKESYLSPEKQKLMRSLKGEKVKADVDWDWNDANARTESKDELWSLDF